MAKPTFLQTLLNQPSRSYIKESAEHQQHSSVYTPLPVPRKRQRKSVDGGNSRRSSTALSTYSLPVTVAAKRSTDYTHHRHSSFHFPTRPPPPLPSLPLPAAHERVVAMDPSSSTLPSSSLPPSTSRRRPRASSVERRPGTVYFEAMEQHPLLSDALEDVSRSSEKVSRRASGFWDGGQSRRKEDKGSDTSKRLPATLKVQEGPVPTLRYTGITSEEEEDSDGENEIFVTPPSSPPSSPRFKAQVPVPPTLSSYNSPTTPNPSATVASSSASSHSSDTTMRAPSHPHQFSQAPMASISEVDAAQRSAPSDDAWTDDTRSISTASSPSRSRNSSWYTPSLTTAPTSASAPSQKGQNSHRRHSRTLDDRPLSMTSTEAAEWSESVKWLGEPKDQYVRPPITTRAWTHIPKGLAKVDKSYTPPTPASGSAGPPYRRRSLDSAVQETTTRASRPVAPPPQPLSRSNSAGSSRSNTSSGSQRRARRSRALAAESAELLKRMSAVLEVDDDGEVIGTTSAKSRDGKNSPPPGPKYRQSRSLSSPSDPKLAVRRAASLSSGTSTSYRTVEIPSIPAVTDGQTTYQNGFTSLILPRAAPSGPSKPDLINGNIDLTLSGQAQATMGTISIIKGGAAVSAAPRRLRRMSWSAPRANREQETPIRLQSGIDASLAFTTVTPTPSKFGSSQVIIKVFAVAISDLDRLVVKQKVKSSKPADGYGFVPGRSFVGRVLDAGWEVNDVRRGDWVMGLTEFSKAGALAEHIVVDRTRVARAPKPGEPFWPGGPTLTMEQVAVLPLSGVPAHRAVKTYPHVAITYVRASRSKKTKDKEEQKSAVLVLGAHTGVGSLVVQEFVAHGEVLVSAHVPDEWDSSSLNGVTEVFEGDAELTLKGLRAGSYIMIVDCVGGEAIRKAAKRVLDPRCGQFTTVVGDEPDVVPTRQAYTKSNLRSLRHVFVRTGNKALGYEWVCPVVDVDHEGDDVRNSLTEITTLVEHGLLVPPIPATVTFERTMDLFKDGAGGDAVAHVLG